jgi:23S rRNA (cytidine1920-2'-O)/16S rRNA (cytidine1409-2'-O)-methyltransferase
MTRRADIALVERGFFASRAKAREAIEAGLVTLDGRMVAKPSEPVAEEARLEASAPYPWVSRGGVKLAAALDAFALDPAGLVCLDVGASTGGFTDCLLQRGAARVYAVDVGHGQLDARLRADPRVVVRERVNARRLSAEDVPESVDLAVVDVSFISLRLILPAVVARVRPGGAAVLLVKPQFEAGRGEVPRGGVVRSEETRRRVVSEIEALGRDLRLEPIGARPSPILGARGNAEFLLGFRVN